MIWFQRLPMWAIVTAWIVFATLLPAIYGGLHGVRDTTARLVHDEYCYLLQADTFARGRMTNPAPKYPEFFESPYLFLEPTYQAKYPPAQAIVLAIGQKWLRHPVWGVWLSCGLFSGALYWMLAAWTNRQWAALGTINAITVVGINHGWAQSYWGGTVAAAGGALVLGGMRWTMRRNTPSAWDGLLTGLGMVILANSRPFEGMVVCVSCAPFLAAWLARGPTPDRFEKLRAWFAPFAAVTTAGIVTMALYNQAVTGDWKTLPYALHPKQYFTCGMFRWQPLDRVPERRSATRARLLYEEAPFLNPGKPGGPKTGARAAIRAFAQTLTTLPRFGVAGWTVYPGGLRSLIIFPFLAICAWALSSSKHRELLLAAWAIILAELTAGATVWWNLPHYNAPIVCLCYFLVVDCLRRACLAGRKFWRPSLIGTRQSIVVLGTIMITMFLAKSFGTAAIAKGDKRKSGFPSPSEPISRSRLLSSLDAQSRPTLVFVAYDSEVTLHDEWVYNSADMDSQRVLLAHDLGGESNQRLVDEFPDRDVWYVQVTKRGGKLHRETGALRRGDGREPSQLESR